MCCNYHHHMQQQLYQVRRLRHRCQTRADLDHRITRLRVNGLNNVFNDAAIRQEMLAEALARDMFHTLG